MRKREREEEGKGKETDEMGRGARRAKVDEFDASRVDVEKEDVFRFEVGVDDVDGRRLEEREGTQDLRPKLPDEIEGQTCEVCPLQQVVQVAVQLLKHNAQIPLVHKRLVQPHCFPPS